MTGSAKKSRPSVKSLSPSDSDSDTSSSGLSSSSSDEDEEGGSRFVQKWINRKYPQLGMTAGFNDLNDMFRYHYGKRAKGLRTALLANVEAGKLGPPKGSGRQQVFAIAGAPDIVDTASWLISQAGLLDSDNSSVGVNKIRQPVIDKSKIDGISKRDKGQKRGNPKKEQDLMEVDGKKCLDAGDSKPFASPPKSTKINATEGSDNDGKRPKRIAGRPKEMKDTEKGKPLNVKGKERQHKGNLKEQKVNREKVKENVNVERVKRGRVKLDKMDIEKEQEKQKVEKEKDKVKEKVKVKVKVKGKIEKVRGKVEEAKPEKKNGILAKLSPKNIEKDHLKIPKKLTVPMKTDDSPAVTHNVEHKLVKDKSKDIGKLKDEKKNNKMGKVKEIKLTGSAHDQQVSKVIDGRDKNSVFAGGKDEGNKERIQLSPEKNDKGKEINNWEKQSVPLKKRLLSAVKEESAPIKKRRLDVEICRNNNGLESNKELEPKVQSTVDIPPRKEIPNITPQTHLGKITNGKHGDANSGNGSKRDSLPSNNFTVPKKRKKFDGDTETSEKKKKIAIGEEEKPIEPSSISPKKRKTILWAKVQNYPWWPARIADPRREDVPPELLNHESKTKNSRLVQFYGTLDYLWVPRSGLKDFRVNFKRFSKEIPPEHASDLEPAIEDAYDEYVEKYGKIVDENDATCEVCKCPDDADRMLLCDKCDSGFHIYCLVPPMSEKDIPSTNWYCDDCVKAECDIDVRGIVTTSYISPGTVGLLNLGSSCYINSFIQCLNSAEAFRKAFLQNMPPISFSTTTLVKRRGNGDTEENCDNAGDSSDDDSDEDAKEKSQVVSKGQNLNSKHKQNNTKEGSDIALSPSSVTAVNQLPVSLGRRNDFILILQALLHSMWQGGGVDRSLLQALRLASGQALAFKYIRSEHQDINEYLMQALEYIHSNHNKSGSNSTVLSSPTPHPPPTSQSSSNTNNTKSSRSLLKDALQRWQEHVGNNPSVISDMFEGMITRSRVCPQGHRSTSYEIFRILPLQFPGNNSTSSSRGRSHSGGDGILLAGMLDHFSHEEKLWCRCNECGGQDNKAFTQKTEIFKFPPFLVVQLGRFAGVVAGEGDDAQWWSNKITTEVTFPVSGLNMQNRFPNCNPQDPPAIYDLIAVANHKGSVSGGHYYTYAKAKDGTWYNYNDHLVKEIKDTQLVSEFAYMLFYERRPASSK